VEAAEPPRPEIAERDDFGLAALFLAAALFVSHFLPWFSFASGWVLRTGDDAGLIALALVLVELLRLVGSWNSHAAQLVGFCLTAAAGIMGVTTFATFRWGSGAPIAFSSLSYGAWLALALGILLIVLAVARLSALRRTAP
jgi:hypothetical protein